MRTRPVPGCAVGLVGLLLGAASAWGGVINTPTPTLNGHASQTVAIIPIVIKHLQQDTEVFCTNLGAGTIDLGFEVFSPTGVLANNVSGPASVTAVPGVVKGLVKGGTATFGTGGTVALHEDTVITLNDALNTPANGSGRIVANVGAQVACVAYAIDSLHQFQTTPTSGVRTTRNPSMTTLVVTTPAGAGTTTTTSSTIAGTTTTTTSSSSTTSTSHTTTTTSTSLPGTTTTSSTIGTTTTSTSLPPPACPASPLAGCRSPFTPGKAKLTVKRPSDPTKQQIVWKWGAGTATSIADFGDPVHATSYSLCIYDSGSLVKTIPIPAGGTCGTKPCWSLNAKGFKWKSKTSATLQLLVLKPGSNGSAQ